MSIDTVDVTALDTPAVLLDHEKLAHNIHSIQQIADAHGAAVRPHAKTHKCHEIARMQLDAGAVGLTVAKPSEALEFMSNGIPSITVAYPMVVPSKLARLFTASSSFGTDLRLVMDSQVGLDAIHEAARRLDITANVMLKVDVGLHRCGLQEVDPELLPLVQRAADAGELNFVGLLAHAGQSYGAADAEAVRQIAQEECGILGRVRNRLEGAGIEVPVVSVGSTPTILASESYEGINEVRPGNYVFMDRTPLRLGLIEADQIALSVLATVVSRNSDYLIVDAGSKVLSSDLGAHGTSGVADFGVAYTVEDFAAKSKGLSVLKLSEEHGFLQRNGTDIPIGSQVRIIPNHSCVVANLVGNYHVIHNGEIKRWKVAAQSCVE
jgi:D-serine deaminase-like pyridoxal phosphate-dependent protein